MKNKLKNIIFGYHWTVGFCSKRIIDEYKFNDIKWVRTRMPYQGIADPFILYYDDNKIVLLVEEIPDSGKGQISRVTIDRSSNSITDCTPILILDTHLSFPAIFRTCDGVYIYPENSASGKLTLYRLNKEWTSCEKIDTIINDALTDAIIFEKNETYFIFATKRNFSNKNKFKIYASKFPFNGYKLHKEISMPSNTARNAGYVISEGQKYYKVSQENDSQIYGHGIVIYEIKDDFEFIEVNRLQPNGIMYQGIHTMNEFNGLVVFDCKKYNTWFGSIICNLIQRIRNLL